LAKLNLNLPLLLEIYKFKKRKDLIVATHDVLLGIRWYYALYEIKDKTKQTNTF
jgi:hypothetical protein